MNHTFGQQPINMEGFVGQTINQIFGQQPINPVAFGDAPTSLKIINAPADANMQHFAMLHDGSTYRLYCLKVGSRDTLYQFAWDGNAYVYGHNANSEVKITGIPADADMDRFTMLHDGSTFRLYCFKADSRDTLYQFAWDGSAYAYGHKAKSEIKIIEMPEDANMNSLAMLSDDDKNYRLYVLQSGNQNILYQAAYVPNAEHYEFGHKSTPQIPVTGFPIDTDYERWSMLYDGKAYRIYFMRQGRMDSLYQGTFNKDATAYQFCC